jgi:DNA-binding response OmpR family regulator
VIKSVEEWGNDEDTEVLLIARDSDVAEMYRMKLEMDGYHVTRIDDLRDRKTIRAGWKPDLVMLDLGDAGATQLSELEHLRSDPVLGSMPLLLLCTDAEEELRRRGVTLRPTDYVLKVAQPGSFGGSVHEWSAIAFSSSAGPSASV